MFSYKFWQTQPVPQFDDNKDVDEGPIKYFDQERVSRAPDTLRDGFEWTTVDMDNINQQQELCHLLANNFVEDNSGEFRFDFTSSFLEWALKPPGWKKEWHIGVRETLTGRLVAFISGIPCDIRIRKKTLKVAVIDFLCIHVDLRSKRLAPVLIKEMTRRCCLEGFFQALYTSGSILPKPIGACRYFHRALNWQKLHDEAFIYLPPRSTKQKEIDKFSLPSDTRIPNMRPMCEEDVSSVQRLLRRYLDRFDLSPVLSVDDVEHWLLPKDQPVQTIWAYVVEDSETGKITDFISFYRQDGQLLFPRANNTSLQTVYLYYYASEMAFSGAGERLQERLVELLNDGLIIAKRANFDLFNAMTCHDNPLFLQQLKFTPGDGTLNYYLFNYRTAPLVGGVNEMNVPDDRRRGGIGIVLP